MKSSGVEETSVGKTGALSGPTPDARTGLGFGGEVELSSVRTIFAAIPPVADTEERGGNPHSVRSKSSRPSSSALSPTSASVLAERLRRFSAEIDPLYDTVAALQLAKAARDAADVLAPTPASVDPPPGVHKLDVIGESDVWRGICKCGWLGPIRDVKTKVQRDYRGHLDES